jgi:hypothetical protein
MSVTKRSSKKLNHPVVKVRPSPFGTKAKDTHAAIAHGSQPQRGVKINGKW